MLKKKILIIEDNMDLANILSLHLADLDYQVKHTADGLTGLSYIEKESFDLVITAAMLPKFHGFQLSELIAKVQS